VLPELRRSSLRDTPKITNPIRQRLLPASQARPRSTLVDLETTVRAPPDARRRLARRRECRPTRDSIEVISATNRRCLLAAAGSTRAAQVHPIGIQYDVLIGPCLSLSGGC
jgi:hypothetical protein